MAKRRLWKRLLLGLLAFIVLFLTLGVPYLFAVLVTRAGTRPMDQRLTSNPADFGLAFEEVSFEAADGVSLRGWYLEGNGESAIAIGHGLFRSRREVLDRAVFFNELGFDTLVFDFRRHGTSSGERTTLGYDERLDFEGAVGFLRTRSSDATTLLYGVSMGAAAAILAGSETDSVAAVIADSPFYSIEHTVVHHVKLIFGLPRFPFASALLFFLELRGGFDRDEFALEPAVVALGDRPIFVVAGGNDARMPVAYQQRLFEASSSAASELWVIEKARHGAGYRTAPEAYQARLRSFLERVGVKLPESTEGEGERNSPSSP